MDRVNIPQPEAGDFTDAQATAQHEQRQGMIHRVRDVGEEGADVVLRERLGQRAPPTQEMTRFDRIAREAVILHHEVFKEMFEGIQPPVDRGRGELRLALLLDERLDVPPGHGTGRFVERRKKQAQIPAIILNGMRRIVPPTQVRTELRDRDAFHRYLPLTACRWAIFAIAVSYWCFLVVS